MTPPTFETRTTAPTWEHGLVAGSGRVGVVLHGPPGRQVLALAHERFFVPVGPRPAAPDLRPVVDELRRATLDGDSGRAGELLTSAVRASGYPDGLIWTDPLGICASLSVTTAQGPHGADGALRREVDLRHGEVAVHWQDAEGGRCTLRVLTPRDEETAWVAVESERGVTARLELGLGGVTETALDTGGTDGSAAVTVTVGGGRTGRLTAATSRSTATVTARAVPADDVVWAAEDGTVGCELAVPAGGRRTLRLDVAVSPGAADETAPRVPARADHRDDDGPDAAPVPDWETLRSRQAATHGRLVDASVLRLGAGAAEADEPADRVATEAVWAAARSGDADAARRVVEIAYLSGRAHAIAATGELPPTLQGVWQGTWRPAWSADWTMNGNVQNGGIASLVPTGTPELARSLLTLVLEHLDDYRDNARLVFGAEGMLLPARLSTHGRANHLDASYPHVFWTGCGGWVLRVAADVVATTGDRTLVDDRLWSLVEGVLRFAETATVHVDGVRRLVPSYSPENTPHGAAGPIAADATMDVAILRDAARCAAVLAAARGDRSLDARWAAVVADLPAYRVADDGTLAEWLAPGTPEEVAHRHASQLYPLWYEVDPAFEGPAGAHLRAAASRTVHAKIAWRAEAPTAPPGRMEMAFGLVQLGLAAAALGDADAALRCVRWLAEDHWRPALTTTHDAGSIFNLDASGGLPALVAAMLLGSTADTLTLLPALPAAWPAGSVTGLRARGGVVVDRLDWDPDGCTATVRRLPAAAWLAPAGGVRLRAGRPFAASGTAVRDGRLDLGEDARVVRLDWTGNAQAGAV